ncbi:MAG: hypothetical protein HOE83_23350 [Alphaproteobacteria bacterium]|jgi:hypothetical protein|nr:hypothetical protein [Alphaproteobacteria bacterium]
MSIYKCPVAHCKSEDINVAVTVWVGANRPLVEEVMTWDGPEDAFCDNCGCSGTIESFKLERKD